MEMIVITYVFFYEPIMKHTHDYDDDLENNLMRKMISLLKATFFLSFMKINFVTISFLRSSNRNKLYLRFFG